MQSLAAHIMGSVDCTLSGTVPAGLTGKLQPAWPAAEEKRQREQKCPGLWEGFRMLPPAGAPS